MHICTCGCVIAAAEGGPEQLGPVVVSGSPCSNSRVHFDVRLKSPRAVCGAGGGGGGGGGGDCYNCGESARPPAIHVLPLRASRTDEDGGGRRQDAGGMMRSRSRSRSSRSSRSRSRRRTVR